MTKTLSAKMMPLACFAAVALSSLSAFAAGPSSTSDSPAGLDSLPLSLRDSLSLPLAEPARGESSFAGSTADAAPMAEASGLSSFDGAPTPMSAPAAMSALAAFGGDSFAMVGDGAGASPMLAAPGFDAQPLGGGVADALAGMNGYGASAMVGDGMGGSPMFLSHGRGASGLHGGVMSMSAWSTSW